MAVQHHREPARGDPATHTPGYQSVTGSGRGPAGSTVNVRTATGRAWSGACRAGGGGGGSVAAAAGPQPASSAASTTAHSRLTPMPAP
ncbi:hypothetical protein AB0K33_23555 [Micromonospora humida]